MRRVLVTGGAGFIGSNFVNYIYVTHNDWIIVNLDSLTYAGNVENLSALKDCDRHIFIKGDINDRDLVSALFEKYKFDYVVNFAAETHVDRSINDPELFLKTNVLGTQCLLDCAKNDWQSGKGNDGYPIFREGVKFLQVSTDEVYGALGKTGKFTEETPLAPNSPYSASKASADLVVRAYNRTYGMPVNITRCSNNYGPYQFPEKLIPLMIGNALENKALPVYGDGLQVRDWLHVLDHCRAIETVLAKGRPGEVYNIGGNNEKANVEIIRLILDTLVKDESLIEHVEDRLGHDRRYAIDSSKIKCELGWEPSYTFEQGIKETISWYLLNRVWFDNVRSGEYIEYYNRFYKDKL